ncbi:MAG TPA: MtnX-like HAD-IB family phosphatase [bacterium]|nr:MtnX-like HAD-IB family phosphatase [bacterium]HQP98338.1 MtnX-like HAD-IB family phosphatase [bacterium]
MKSPTIMMKTVYFVDFDNTVSMVDVWDTIVSRFSTGNWEQVIRDYDEHRISSWEFNTKMLRNLQGHREEVLRLISTVQVDSAFARFVELARSQDREILLVSDGYDFYIDPLLKKAGVPSLPYVSNHMEWTDGTVRWDFPHFLPDCERKMANCKCQYLRLEESGLRRVYIGDGVSDICAAEKVEVVYAKGDLRRYLESVGRDFHPFETFADVVAHEFADA